jgi:hypothetical protein
MRLNIDRALNRSHDRELHHVYQRFSDGLNPVIFDTDGSITDSIFGVGAKSNVPDLPGRPISRRARRPGNTPKASGHQRFHQHHGLDVDESSHTSSVISSALTIRN